MRKLFVSHLKSTNVTLENTKGLMVTTKLVGTMCLILVDNGNRHHKYEIPGCVFDPGSLLSILGVPFLCAYFWDGADDEDLYTNNRTNICSGSTKLHVMWNKYKHKYLFMHDATQLPELHLYIGRGYFSPSMTQIEKYFGDKLYYALNSG